MSDEIPPAIKALRTAHQWRLSHIEALGESDDSIPPHHAHLASAGAVLHRYAHEIYDQAQVSGDDHADLMHFKELVRKWHDETDHLSSPVDIAMNFNYQQILGKGERYLPFIFDELRSNGGKWYWALRAITEADPVPQADRGNVAKMKQAWLDWWDRNG